MKQLTLLTALLTCLVVRSQYSVLPFTGLRYEAHGITAETIQVELDGAVWTSNRLPVNTGFELRLENPAGFTEQDGLYYPGVEVLITRPNGDTLGYAPDIMGGESFDGLSGMELSNLSLTLAFNEQTAVGDTCLLWTRFFDSRGTHEWIGRMDIVIADPDLPLANTWSTYGVSSWKGHSGKSTGAEISSISMERDTLSAGGDFYLLTIDPVAGVSLPEWQSGTVTVTGYDAQGDYTVFPANRYRQTIAFSGKQEGLKTDLRIRASFSKELRTIRFRWENTDGTKVVDVVSTLPR